MNEVMNKAIREAQAVLPRDGGVNPVAMEEKDWTRQDEKYLSKKSRILPQKRMKSIIPSCKMR